MSVGSEQFLTLLERLDRSDDNLRIAHSDNRDFTSFPTTAVSMEQALEVLKERNVWFEVNSSSFTGAELRSNKTHITRLSSLYIDIDYKAGGMGSLPAAEDLVANLSGALGVPPAAIVHTGHGLQAYWPISDGHITDENRDAVGHILARWKVMSQSFAAALGGQVDAIFDLPRILRVPGSVNVKYEDHPIPVYADFPDGWESFTIAELVDIFDEYGIIAVEDETPGGVVSAMSEWDWAERDCQHVTVFINEMQAANPGSRHGWLLQQAALIYGMIRYGCVTEETFERLRRMLDQRFTEVCASSATPRTPTQHELRSAFTWGGEAASQWSNQKLIDEMRQHVHNDFVAQFTRGAGIVSATQLAMPAAHVQPASPDAQNVIDLFSKRPVTSAPIQHIQSMPFDGSLALSPQAQVRLTHAAHSDVGNAEMFAGHVAGRFLYISGNDAGWYAWDGSRWQADIVGLHREALKDMLSTRLTSTQDPVEAKWLLSSMNNSRMNATLKWAESVASVRATTNEMDADIMELATPAGIVDLRAGTFRTPNPLTDRNTKQTKYPPAFDRRPVQFLKFLDWAFGHQEGMIDYLQRLFGAALMGEQRLQIFPVLLGSGSNGKSALFTILLELLGDYALKMPSKFLIKQRNDPHPEAIAALKGIRLALANEVPEGATFDEELVKAITGDTTLTARKMRENSAPFLNTCSLWMAANDLPAVKGGGPSWWRRIRILDMPNIVVEGVDADPDLPARLLREEGDAILGWMIQGAQLLLENGELAPPQVKAANAEYRREEDSMARFIGDNLIPTPGGEVDRGVVYHRYVSWATSERLFPLLSGPKFMRAILMMHPTARLGADTVYTGLHLANVTPPEGFFGGFPVYPPR